MFRVSVSLLTVCVHGEGEVGVGLANILQLFYGQVSELILGRERKKIRKKVSLQRLLYETGKRTLQKAETQDEEGNHYF